jgi:hypothetical protein
MATIKAYTDLSQSKTLSKILPLESADMRFCFSHTLDGRITGHYPMIGNEPSLGTVPCWSLARLLDVLSEIKPLVYTPILFPSEGKWILQFAEYGHGNICEVTCDNPVDACVAMIEKLHELNLL